MFSLILVFYRKCQLSGKIIYITSSTLEWTVRNNKKKIVRVDRYNLYIVKLLLLWKNKNKHVLSKNNKHGAKKVVFASTFVYFYYYYRKPKLKLIILRCTELPIAYKFQTGSILIVFQMTGQNVTLDYLPREGIWS